MRYQYGSTIVESGDKLDSILFKPVTEEAKPKAAEEKPAKAKTAKKGK